MRLFGVPGVAVASLSGGLLFGYDRSAGGGSGSGQGGGFPHRGVDRLEEIQTPLGEVASQKFDIQAHGKKP